MKYYVCIIQQNTDLHPTQAVFIKIQSFNFVAKLGNPFQFSSGIKSYVKLNSDTVQEYDTFAAMCRG